MRRCFLVVLTAFLLIGCNTAKVVTETRVERVHDTLRVETMRVDSVYVSHHVSTRNDTTFVRDTIYRWQKADKAEAEVVVVERVDSIPYEVEVVREVRKRSGYDKFCSGFFWSAIAAALLWVALKMAKRYFFIR